jgi:hypothetical protein
MGKSNNIKFLYDLIPDTNITNPKYAVKMKFGAHLYGAATPDSDVANIPQHHKDPFDRILISQSIQVDIPIMTVDKQFKLYEVNVILAG